MWFLNQMLAEATRASLRMNLFGFFLKLDPQSLTVDDTRAIHSADGLWPAGQPSKVTTDGGPDAKHQDVGGNHARGQDCRLQKGG